MPNAECLNAESQFSALRVKFLRDHPHDTRTPELAGRRGVQRYRRDRTVRNRTLGQGLLLDIAVGSRPRAPDEGRRTLDRPQAADRPPAAARDRPADPDPLQRHPAAPGRRHPQRLQDGHQPARLRRPLHLRLPDQGEPAAAGRRGGAGFRPGVRLRPRSRLQAGAAGRGRAGVQRHADHLQRLQGRRVHRDGDARPEDRAQRHSGRREVHRAGADPEVRREGRRAAADRHAREARGPRRRTLAGVGRLPVEVRPDGRRGSARARGAALTRDGRLLQAAALPSRQPDPEHPHRQGGAERSGPRLRRAGQGRAPGWSISTSAADSASTTTVRRRTSSRA